MQIRALHGPVRDGHVSWSDTQQRVVVLHPLDDSCILFPDPLQLRPCFTVSDVDALKFSLLMVEGDWNYLRSLQTSDAAGVSTSTVSED